MWSFFLVVNIKMIITHIIVLVARHEVLGNVDGEDVGEELLVVRLQVLHLLLLLWTVMIMMMMVMLMF